MTSRWPLRYAPWTIRDFAFGPGLIYLAVVVFATWILSHAGTGSATAGEVGQLLTVVLGQVSMPFVLLATGGMVHNDLTAGYYRTIFAKPVSPVAYYLQRWLIGGLGVLLTVLLFAAGLAMARHAWPTVGWQAPARVALLYLLLGGLVFLFSVLNWRDWILAALVYILEMVLHEVAATNLFGPLLRWLSAVLPPFHLLSGRAPFPAGLDLLHVIAYGVALVAGALALLRWRALGSGGRA